MKRNEKESLEKTVTIAIDDETRRTLTKASRAVSEVAGAFVQASDGAVLQKRS